MDVQALLPRLAHAPAALCCLTQGHQQQLDPVLAAAGAAEPLSLLLLVQMQWKLQLCQAQLLYQHELQAPHHPSWPLLQLPPWPSSARYPLLAQEGTHPATGPANGTHAPQPPLLLPLPPSHQQALQHRLRRKAPAQLWSWSGWRALQR